VTVPEETTVPTPETTEETTAEETAKEVTEETAELTTEPEVTTVPDVSDEITSPSLDSGCFSFISFSALALVLAGIVMLRKREN
jgi:hypothetical protein